eukprot:1179644-Prorocentrum_minimum.AAC.1
MGISAIFSQLFGERFEGQCFINIDALNISIPANFTSLLGETPLTRATNHALKRGGGDNNITSFDGSSCESYQPTRLVPLLCLCWRGSGDIRDFPEILFRNSEVGKLTGRDPPSANGCSVL